MIHVTYLVPAVTGAVPPQSKIITPEGSTYAPQREWKWKHREYSTTSEFFSGLRTASASRAAVVMRNKIMVTDPVIARKAGETVNPRSGTSWVCLDFDLSGKDIPHFEDHKLKVLDLSPAEKMAVAREFVESKLRNLPNWVQSTRKLIHLSSSWMINKLSFHVWFVCDQDIPAGNVIHIIRECSNGKVQADTAMSRTGQIHLIADPIFVNASDPWEGCERWFELPGSDIAALPRKHSFVSVLDEHLPVESVESVPSEIPENREWTSYGSSAISRMEWEAKNTPDGDRHRKYASQAYRIRDLIAQGHVDGSAIQRWGQTWFVVWGCEPQREREIRRLAKSVFGVE